MKKANIKAVKTFMTKQGFKLAGQNETSYTVKSGSTRKALDLHFVKGDKTSTIRVGKVRYWKVD